jgi:hypothetical protein
VPAIFGILTTTKEQTVMVQPHKTQPDPSRSSLPWAVVTVVRGQEGPGFGYTNGLWGLYQHPELWMGEVSNDLLPIQLCGRELGPLLNVLAAIVRDGRPLPPGELVRMTDPRLKLDLDFRIGRPADRRAVEALLVAPSAKVLPVKWTANWRGDPPEQLRTPTGGVLCRCEPQECPECAAENRAVRRARHGR